MRLERALSPLDCEQEDGAIPAAMVALCLMGLKSAAEDSPITAIELGEAIEHFMREARLVWSDFGRTEGDCVLRQMPKPRAVTDDR